MIRRKSTLGWGRKHAAHIPAIAKVLNLPMVPNILDTIDDNRGAVFYVMALAQVFKSLLGQLRVLRSMQVEPVPSLWYGPTGENVEDFVAEKLNPLIDSCTPIQPLFFAEKHKRQNERISFPAGMYLLLLTAGAEPNRQSKTAADIYFDEPWMYEAGWIEECQRRHGDFPYTFREFFMSTGPTEGATAAQIWKNTDQRTWFVRCPACEKLFEPRFAHEAGGEIIGGVIYDKVMRPDGLPDERAIRASTYYKCPECKVHIPDGANSLLALNGTAAAPRGEYVPLNLNPSPSHFGWNVNGCAVRGWGDLSTRWVKAQLARERGDLVPMERIVRLDFAGIWSPEPFFTRDASQQQIGDYSMGEAWEGEISDEQGRPWRFADIDVQQDHYYLVIRMWGRFSESRARWAARCMSISDVEVICQEHKVEPFRIFMDGRYDTQRVRRICAIKGWKVFMGDKDNRRGYRHPDGIFKIFDVPSYQDPLIGTPEQGTGSTVTEILFSKQMALNRLHLLRHETFQPLRGKDADSDPPRRPLWTAAKNMPEWYWPQMAAHFRKPVTASDGSVSYVWMGLKDDHAADVEAMHVVSASMGGLTGAESLEPPPPPPAEIKPA